MIFHAKTYCCPPCSRVVQSTVVAVLQAAGVRDTRGIVNLKPVCVVGDSTATELHQKKRHMSRKCGFLLSTEIFFHQNKQASFTNRMYIHLPKIRCNVWSNLFVSYITVYCCCLCAICVNAII